MTFVRNYHSLLRITMPFVAWFLSMGCSDDGIQVMPETQPARLIRVTARNSFQGTTFQHFPNENDDGILSPQDWVELVFDKSVSQLIIDVDGILGYATPNGIPPTTIWQLKVGDLGLPSLPYLSNPKKNVPFTVIYEDKTGIHQETFEVALGDYEPGPDPPRIDSSNVWNNQVDADANQLNRDGIKITFSVRMDPFRTLIEVYTGQVQLDWKIYWTDRIKTVILLPENHNDLLLTGQQYEVHFVALYSAGGVRDGAVGDRPIVLSFKTASDKQ